MGQVRRAKLEQSLSLPISLDLAIAGQVIILGSENTGRCAMKKRHGRNIGARDSRPIQADGPKLLHRRSSFRFLLAPLCRPR